METSSLERVKRQQELRRELEETEYVDEKKRQNEKDTRKLIK